LGLALGSLFHVALAVAGLATLLSYAPTLYDAIRLAGAAYLIYLGIKTLRAPGASMPANGGARRSLARILFDAALVEMLNPKTALFFLAFLHHSSSPRQGRRTTALPLGLIVTHTALPSDMLVALAGPARPPLHHPGHRRWPSRSEARP
jgi:threonine/homoserine/homoserine lactone efflux protein